MFCRFGLMFAISAAAILSPATGGNARADAVDRLKPEYLKSLHAAIEGLKQDRQTVVLPSQFTDYRGAMHVHSGLSHDSRSPLSEVVAGAKKAGLRFVMFTEHPVPGHDYFKEGHRGLVDGVLLIPGAELTGLLAFPEASVPEGSTEPQAEVDAILKTHGQVFLCHLEERMDWDLKGLTGSEIYNLHADFKDETRLIKSMLSLTGLFSLLSASRDYPQETMASLMDYPADYLRRYDQLCEKSRLTGIAANDAHHNNAIKGIILDDGKLQLVDALGTKLVRIDPNMLPVLKPLLAGLHPGETKVLLDLDPYERSFRHVATHVFLPELTERALRDGLTAGRAYVSFEWIADPTGFNFQALRGNTVYEMGSEVPFTEGITFRSVSPLPARFRLIRNGKEVHTAIGRSYEHAIDSPGNYRLEVWVNLADTPEVWILSNPIYVRG